MKENNNNTKNENLVYKVYFILKSILYYGSTKLLIYLSSIEKSKEFKIILEWMKMLVNIDINTYEIYHNTTKLKRLEIINKFKSMDKINIILNVQVLNEGIDIRECDSVFITNPTKNIINIIPNKEYN
jgi:superfamily II DNA or RNA helicase